MNAATHLHLVDHAFGPERADFENRAKPCICGAQPLLSESNGLFYMSCPPCFVRGHKLATAKAAKRQWNSMITYASKTD